MNTPLPFDAARTLLRYHRPSLTAFDDGRASGRLAHAWLLYGPPGCGADIMAQVLAMQVLSGQNQDAGPSLLAGLLPEPEPDLDPALWDHLQHNSHPDVMIVQKPDDKTGISVDATRNACAFLAKTSSLGMGKVLLILGAESMNHQAANALLKRLEEPAAGSLLILTTTALGALPVTIRSRCWRLRLRGLDAPTFMACVPDSTEDTYRAHGGNMDTALGQGHDPLIAAAHRWHQAIVSKARRGDPSVSNDINRYQALMPWVHDKNTYHLDAGAVSLLFEKAPL